MTRGISEERLIEIINHSPNIDINELLEECTELNPWLPIDSAPLNEPIRVFTRFSKRQVDTTLYFEDDRERYTHFCELPDDPK